MEETNSNGDPKDRDFGEFSVLKKYRAEYPDFLAFQDLNDRSLSADERLTEFELEKLTIKIEELVQQRRSIYSSPSDITNIGLPLLTHTVTAQEARDQRNQLFSELGSVPKPEKLVIHADVLMKEVALAAEPKNSLQFVVGTLVDYYRNRLKVLPHKKCKLLFRWSRFCQSPELLAKCDPIVKSRLRQIAMEYEATQERIDRLSAYLQAACTPPSKAVGKGRRLQKGQVHIQDLHSSPLHQQFNQANTTRADLTTSDFQVFFRDQLHDTRAKKRLRRLIKRTGWLCYARRYELYSTAIESIVPNDEANPPADENGIPTMASTDEEVAELLEELVQCFKIPTKSDPQELFYSIHKRFAAVFHSQTSASVFPPYELQSQQGWTAPQSNMNDGGMWQSNPTPIYLKASPWIQESNPFHPVQSAWEEKQRAHLRSIRPPDRPLEVELEFLSESAIQEVVHRLKEQAETHLERGEVRRKTQGHEKIGQRTRDGKKPPPKKDSRSDVATSYKRQALYLLRYIRIREFKRKLLDLMNYFRSIERRLVYDFYGFVPPSAPSKSQKPTSLSTNTTCVSQLPPEDLSAQFDNAEQESFAEGGRDSYTQSILNYHAQPSDYTGASSRTTSSFEVDGIGSDADERMTSMNMASIQNRDDKYLVSPSQDILVQDSNGVYVMYDTAAPDLQRLEEEMLQIGTYYCKRHASSDTDQSQFEVDRVRMLEDLYECETWYQDGKRKVMNCLIEAYEHTVDPQEQRNLAQSISNLMARRPLLDLKAEYFSESYSSEIVALELQYSLYREIINSQITEEKGLFQQVQKTLAGKKDSTAAMGYPELPMVDSRFSMPLFPESTVINVLDFYPSIAQLATLQTVIEDCVGSICTRFNVGQALAITGVRRVLLQQIMIEWKLLSEEVRIQRQMQVTEDYDVYSLLDDPEAIDHLAEDLAQSEADGFVGGKKRGVGSGPASPQTRGDEGGDGKGGEGEEDDSARVYHTVGGLDSRDGKAFLFQVYFNIFDCILMRNDLLDALYETELLYNVHRRQGRQMGIDVKRFHLEPIDFERKKAYTEVDELLREDTDLAEVVGIRTEYLSNLAISEFESAMAQFDFYSINGLKKVVSHGMPDLRRALVVQLVQKTMLKIVCHYNQVPLDYFYESQTYLKLQKPPDDEDSTFVTKSQPDSAPGSPLAGPYQPDQYSPGTLPKYKLNTLVQQPMLQKLFVSVNQIKSVHRKGILSELTEQSAEIVNSKRPELIRKKMRELKCNLVDHYCEGVLRSMYSYSVKHQVAATVEGLLQELSYLPAEKAVGGKDCPFTYGQPSDQMRMMARPLHRGERDPDRVPCCLLARDGRVEEVWYLPHFLQLYHLNWDSERERTIDDIRLHEHVHTHGATHLKTNLCLRTLLRIVAAFASIYLFAKADSCMHVGSAQAALPGSGLDKVLEELAKVQFELDNLMDPNDTQNVVEYLEHKVWQYHIRLLVTGYNALQRLKGNPSDAVIQRLVDQLHAPANAAQGAADTQPWLHLQARGVEGSLTHRFPREHHNGTVHFRSWLQRLEHPQFNMDPDMIMNPDLLTAPGFYSDLATLRRSVCLEALPRLQYLDPFLLALPDFDRNPVWVEELRKVDMLLQEARYQEEAKMKMQDVPFSGVQVCTRALEVLTRRHNFRQFWFSLIDAEGSTEEHDADWHEEQFQKVIANKAKHLYEIDAVEENSTSEEEGVRLAKKKGGKKDEVELRRKQVLVLRQDINKRLMRRTLRYLQAVIQALMQHNVRASSSLQAQMGTEDAPKLAMFKAFATTLLSRAMAVRSEGTDGFMFQIPEATIVRALDELGQSLREWDDQQLRDIARTSEMALTHYKQTVFNLEQKTKYLTMLRELDQKSLDRRVLSRVTDDKYDLIFKADLLQKRNESLERGIQNVETAVRNKVKLEYDDKVNALKNEILLVQGKFKDYKAKLFREMHVNLEDIKRSAFLQIGKSDVAPLHMKRQALRIAITEDEINKLKDDNAQLTLTVTKLKLWHEMKLMNLVSMYEKKLAQAEQEKEESSSQYWGNQKTIEEKEELLRQQLAQTQNSLSQCEMEVEQLRKDLQLQLKNKKDLVTWKVTHSKTLEEMTKKIKKYEKWSQYDMDKVLLEMEKKKADVQKVMATVKDSDSGRPHPDTTVQAPGSDNRKDREIQKLKLQLLKEQKLKAKAFQKLDQIRQADGEEAPDAGEWHHKYLECAAELLRSQRELEVYRDHITQNSLPAPSAETLAAVTQQPAFGYSMGHSEMPARRSINSQGLPSISEPATASFGRNMPRKTASAPQTRPRPTTGGGPAPSIMGAPGARHGWGRSLGRA
mmetsp:Transcript_13593/g.24229  ORF Transcript_13593/g.24229 Transcript_13593/m.24229 type:complete len:2316 (-) Transcript_13593:702-7649(-)